MAADPWEAQVRYAVEIDVRDINEPPTLQPFEVELAESALPDAVVGTLRADDEDADPQHTVASFSLASASEKFAVLGDGSVVVAQDAAFDFESQRYFALSARVVDHGGLFDDTMPREAWARMR